MAGYDNIKDHGFDKRTAEEQRKIASMGGKASGEARRRKANFKKTLNMLLTAEIDNPEITPILEALGIDSTFESAINMAMIKEAMTGNVKAYEAIAKHSGQIAESEARTAKLEAEVEKLKRENSDANDNDQVMEFIRAMRNDNTEQKTD